MKTHTVPTATPSQIQDAVESAVYLLSGGFPVALPTETVYGLAAWATNPECGAAGFQCEGSAEF